jgi:4'-phosphopantetheinyl transferase
MLHQRMPLAADEVHVWQASLTDRPGSYHQSGLSPEELERADRIGNPERRHGFLVARAMVRGVLAHELGADAAALRFAVGPHGKPFLDPPALRFNLSHSGDVVVVAVADDREVGVDVERIKPAIDHAALARRFFSPLENEQLATLAPSLQHAAFFAAWTRKEALVKAWGVGLSLPLNRFDVSLLPHRPAQLLGAREGAGRLGHWSVHELDSGPGYAAAVAVEGVLGDLTYRRWGHDEEEPAPRKGRAPTVLR